MRRILLVGATGKLGAALARELGAAGDTLYLAGRNQSRLATLAGELAAGGPPVAFGRFHAEDFAAHDGLLDDAHIRLGGLDGVVYCAGGSGDAGRAARDFDRALAVLQANYTGALSLLGRFARRTDLGPRPFVAALSSILAAVAAHENPVYTGAKEALNRFLADLDRRETPRLRAVTVLLGNLATDGGARGLLPAATPEAAARGIARALDGAGGAVYVPGFWRWIMAFCRLLPAALMRRATRTRPAR